MSSPTSHPGITLCGQKIDRPGHICAFFDSRDEKYDALSDYFSEGIAAGERIINVVDGDAVPGHVEELESRDCRVGEAMAHSQFSLLTSEETYLKDNAMTLDGMIDLLRKALSDCQRDGIRIRTCGEMSWMTRSPILPERVMEYEARVNEFVPAFQCTLLCVYDLNAITASLMSDILATHSFAIINGRARENPYYVPPAEYMQMLRTATFESRATRA